MNKEKTSPAPGEAATTPGAEGDWLDRYLGRVQESAWRAAEAGKDGLIP